MTAACPFDEIALWPVAPCASGAEHMALDEVMLRLADRPLLRVYRWTRREVTFGYPQRWEEAKIFAGARPATRRCTGGGFVEHGEDVTVALAVPTAHPFGRIAPQEAYRRIHEAIRAVLGGGIRLAGAADCSSGAACFSSPAQCDLLKEGRKILGGAQRRSRDGFLYQGSVQGIGAPPDFGERLAAEMARFAAKWNPPSEWTALRDELLRDRYGSQDWNRRR
ncbi:MAG: hypothetical protein PHC88_07990 [Terrimicrobiaceae bacterium]|nr:hypothetical protein [Terrimicrobiaceae bacterium]